MIRSRRMTDGFPSWCRFPLLLGSMTLVALLFSLIPAQAAEKPNCASVNGISFICGVTNVEDFAPVPHTKWVIGGDLSAASHPQGYLYLFDTSNNTATAVQPSEIAIRPDKKTYPDCPGPVDMKTFGPHGLDITRTGTRHLLYAVNHGGRESVEVFIVDLTKARPALTWIGCTVAPQGFWPDAVASLPDGGIVVTSLWDPTDADRLNKLSNGQPVGALDEWHPGKGWTPIPGAEGMSGPNGVIVTPDGKDIYVAVWSGKQLVRINRAKNPAKVDSVPTGILTDNVRWSPSGKEIFVGGQDATVKQVLECFEFERRELQRAVQDLPGRPSDAEDDRNCQKRCLWRHGCRNRRYPGWQQNLGQYVSGATGSGFSRPSESRQWPRPVMTELPGPGCGGLNVIILAERYYISRPMNRSFSYSRPAGILSVSPTAALATARHTRQRQRQPDATATPPTVQPPPAYRPLAHSN